MPLRSGFRRRALSNAADDERQQGSQQSSGQTPPLPSLSHLKAFPSRKAPAATTTATITAATSPKSGHFMQQQEDDTFNEVYATIWRQSSCGRTENEVVGGGGIEILTPPASPTRFTFSASPTQSLSQQAKARHGSLKKCLSPSNLINSSNFVGSLLRWRDRRRDRMDEKEREAHCLAIQSQSFLDFGSSRESVIPTCTSSSSSSPSRMIKTSQTQSSPLTNTPPESPCQTESTTFYSSSTPSSALHSSRSFGTLRNTIKWEQLVLPSQPIRPSKRSQRNHSTLPPPLPPPKEGLPTLPSPSLRAQTLRRNRSNQAKRSQSNLHVSFEQWENELKMMSNLLYGIGDSDDLQVKQPMRENTNGLGGFVDTDIDRDASTPSTMTPSQSTPRKDAFEFDLDDPMTGVSSLTSKMQSNDLTCDSAINTEDDEVNFHHFPKPPLRIDTSSSGEGLAFFDGSHLASQDSSIIRSSITSFYTATSKLPCAKFNMEEGSRCSH